MSRFGVDKVIQVLALALVAGTALHAQSIAGRWVGSRSERNPMNSQTFTVNFVFEFASDGTYREQASFGTWTVLRLSGSYQLSRGRNPSDPTVSHVLSLRPQQVETAPNEQAKMLLDTACVANTDSTQQYVTFFNVAPLGGMSLHNVEGGESWGMNRVQ